MKSLNEYPTPKTDDYIGDQTGVILTPGKEAMCDFASDLERKLARCRDALRIIRKTSEPTAVLTYQRMENIAIEALEATE